MTQAKTICVYCGASDRVAARYLDAAGLLGTLIGEAGIGLVYGGGRTGLMGRVADGVLATGAAVTGIIPSHLHSIEIAHDGVADLIVVETMHDRKRLMAERSDAFVVLPGGYGTLEELFEILTWRQLRLHDKPIIIVNVDDYWTPLLDVLAAMVAGGFAPDIPLYRVVSRVDEVLDALRAAPPETTRLAASRL